jgi:TolB protein
MNANGSHQTRLTHDSSFDESPAFSPDGKKIVFRGPSANGFSFEIWVMNANGSHLTRLTNDSGEGDADPNWGPLPR